MRKQPSTRLTAILLSAFVLLASPSPADAQSGARGASGLPLPRFVSLKAEKVNMRIGPGIDYAIAWRYMRSGIPIEIIQEYDNWRKVRDAEGAEGWINQALLSGERTAMIAPWRRDQAEAAMVSMTSQKDDRGRTVARLQPGVVVHIIGCDGEFCETSVDGVEGWVAQNELWGAYPGEAFR